MARDNELIITAGLAIPETTEDISKDLKQVGDRLNTDHALKIVCNIDLSKTTQRIQSQLNTISKDFSIKIGKIDLNSIQNNISRQTNGLETKVRITPEIDKRSLTDKAKDLAESLSKELEDKSIKKRTREILQYSKEALGGERATAIEEANGQLQKFAIYVNTSENATEKLTFKLNKLSNAFEYVGKSIHEANNSTDLRKKPVDVSRDIQIGELDKFSMKVASSGIVNGEEFKNKVQDLRKQLEDVFDTTSLNAFLNAFSRVKAEFESFESVTSSINDSIKQLDKMSGNVNLSKNLSDPQVQNQIQLITELRGEYEKLLQDVSETKDIKSLADIESKVHFLNSRILEVRQSTDALSSSLKSSSALETLNNRIQKTVSSMEVYANSNKKAISSTKLMSDGVTTFAEKWDELTSKIRSGNLSADEFKHLNEEIATFKQEVKAAGLDSGVFFRKMGDQIRLVVTQWISLNAVIAAVRNTTEELKQIDDILTEISKTSDRTTESLKKLGDTSYDTANKYGRKASDYLLGVQEMSRAGFGDQQSEDLAELSILAQAAGDMTAEMSNEYIVATDAAYGLEGSVEKLNAVLDGQNYITNRNALSMENLSQATKVAASQASASGIAIDELSAAVGTMVATTQQGGDVAGRAFKGILMNLQQVKADASEIGDGGESITEESLSKYEEATKALGVSLKEVKNGVWELRDPMQILKELSEAVSKESQGSIKVANLINAVGGKLRGNQLIALLNNWETYEKMLSEFNSDQAVGSAMEEAEKSANNWSGSLNNLSNSWSELVSKFVESDNVIEIVQSLDNVIQNLTDSAVTGTLGTIADVFTGIIKLIGNVSDNLGTLPTLMGAIAGGLSFKGVGRPQTE
ncbi:MAG: phage tail tape measure protein, partial [Ruminococcus flavefaciens]|nr:phage tail tape measure protein [Ruminococcus flavefaciens]